MNNYGHKLSETNLSRKAAVRKIGILFANAWVLTVTKWTPRVLLVYIDLSGI